MSAGPTDRDRDLVVDTVNYHCNSVHRLVDPFLLLCVSGGTARGEVMARGQSGHERGACDDGQWATGPTVAFREGSDRTRGDDAVPAGGLEVVAAFVAAGEMVTSSVSTDCCVASDKKSVGT